MKKKKQDMPVQQSFFDEPVAIILPQEKKSVHKSTIEDIDISKIGLVASYEAGTFGDYVASLTFKTNSSKYDR